MAVKEKENPLKDIMGPKVEGDEGFIFKKFKERKAVLKDILNVFTNGDYSNSESDDEKTGYFISENDYNEVGVISHCLAISTFVALLGNGELIEDVYKHNSEIMFAFDNIIDEVNYNANSIKDLSDNEPSSLRYTAKPYLDDDKERTTKITTFTETMAKVLSASCDMRFYLMRAKEANLAIDDFDTYLKKAEDLICLSMHDLTCAAIEIKVNPGARPPFFAPFGDESYFQKGSENIDTTPYTLKYKGWNFLSARLPRSTRSSIAKLDSVNYGFSYYMTYSVASAYTTFYNYFKWNIDECRELRKHKKEVESGLSKSNKPVYKANKIPADKLHLYEENRDFITSIFDKYYFEFSKTVLDAGRYINMKMYKKASLDISQDFLGNDFTAVTQENIETSSTNDALFNTLFAFGIFLSAGLDIDYRDFGEDARDRFFSDLNYGLINVDKTLKYLIKNNKEYIVKQHILSVWERMPNDIPYIAINAKKIRKRRIQAMTIVPLLINVHCEVSKYITNYPEREMSTYLSYILDKRFVNEDDEKIWAWDDDGYDLNNTLLYIKALNNFYEYYEKYEAPFYQKEVQNQDALKNYKKQAQREVDAKNVEIESLKAQIVDLQKKDPLTLALEGLFARYLKENLPAILAEVFTNEVSEHSLKDNDGNYSPLYESVLNLIMSYAVEPLRGNSDLKITMFDEQQGGYKVNKESVDFLIKALRKRLLAELAKLASDSYKKEEESGGVK